MSDWKNQIIPIINKIKQQLHARKIDDLESIERWVQTFDKDQNGFLEKYEFEQFLSKIGIFLTTQEFRCVYNTYDNNKDGRISYVEFIEMIRTSMSEKRLSVVKHAFQFLDQQNTGLLSLQLLFSKFLAKEHPRVLAKQKTAEQVNQEFQSGISKKSKDGVNINEAEFLDYYADINATLPNEKEEYFVGQVLKTWGIISVDDYVSPDRLADLEMILYEKIRQKTLTVEDEGKTLEKAFKYFDIQNTGIVEINQFKQVLDKFGCNFNQKEIQAVFAKYDKDRNGRLCYDEFCGIFAQIGSGNNPNVSSVFRTEREPPKATLARIRQSLYQKDNGAEFLKECFIKSDKNSNGSLDRDEFRWAMKEAGCLLTQTEFDNLFKYFDKHNTNSVSYDNFISLILDY